MKPPEGGHSTPAFFVYKGGGALNPIYKGGALNPRCFFLPLVYRGGGTQPQIPFIGGEGPTQPQIRFIGISVFLPSLVNVDHKGVFYY